MVTCQNSHPSFERHGGKIFVKTKQRSCFPSSVIGLKYFLFLKDKREKKKKEEIRPIFSSRSCTASRNQFSFFHIIKEALQIPNKNKLLNLKVNGGGGIQK